ncbi:MAG: hypothetical protein CMI52_01360 [Parcubacteria group bacterium]|nr:hypothetical protein [Parcubacteria group bacterium]
MSSSKKRQKKKYVLKMPSTLEVMKSVRGAPIPPGRKHKAVKGKKVKYNRTATKRRLKREDDHN